MHAQGRRTYIVVILDLLTGVEQLSLIGKKHLFSLGAGSRDYRRGSGGSCSGAKQFL